MFPSWKNIQDFLEDKWYKITVKSESLAIRDYIIKENYYVITKSAM